MELDHPASLLPAALVAEVEAAAAAEQRPVGEILQDAVESYLRDRRAKTDASPAIPRTPADAAKRMLERRKLHPLPDGTTVRDLMSYGRA